MGDGAVHYSILTHAVTHVQDRKQVAAAANDNNGYVLLQLEIIEACSLTQPTSVKQKKLSTIASSPCQRLAHSTQNACANNLLQKAAGCSLLHVQGTNCHPNPEAPAPASVRPMLNRSDLVQTHFGCCL